MKKSIVILILVLFAEAKAQNLGDKTAFHVPVSSAFSDFGPAYSTPTSYGGIGYSADVRGNNNQAMQLDGVDDYVSYPSNTKFQSGLPFSFSVWVNLDQLTGNFPVFATDNSTAAYAGVFVQIASGIVYISYGDGISYGTGNRCSIQSANAITAGKWYHIAGVIRGFQDMDLYIDGVKETAGTYSGSGSSNTIGHLGSTLSIGMLSGKGSGQNSYFKGKIDDLHLWQRELSAFEIELKRNVLLSYSVIPGGVLEDDGPFGMQLENMGYPEGKDRYNKSGQTMQMNGTTHYSRIPASSAYRTQFPLTVSAWVKINSQRVIQPIFATSDHVSSKYSGLFFYLENGKPAVVEGDNQGAGIQFRRSFVAGDSLKVGQWYHLVAVCSALGSTRIYVNGNEVLNGSNSGTGTAMVHGSGYGFVGYLSEPNGGAARYLDGSLDEVMLVSAAWTPSQITSAYKPGVYFQTEPNDTAVARAAGIKLRTNAASKSTVAYQWYHKNTNTWVLLNAKTSKDLDIASVVESDTGMYRCVATVSGVSVNSREARVALIPVNKINQNSLNSLSVYPNPVKNSLLVENVKGEIEIEIADSKGAIVIQTKIIANAMISMEKLPVGMYYIRCMQGNEIVTYKVIKQ